MRNGLALMALFVSMLSAMLHADPVADGLVAWQAKDYAAAHQYWQSAAKSGDTQAMFMLSELYSKGKGVSADQTQAADWLRQAAEHGHHLACYNLGDRYLQGLGVAKDSAQAAYWWRCAALQGLAQAQYNLGTLYYRGLGVSPDKAQAAWWYQQAARQGSHRAEQALRVLQRAGITPPAEPPVSAVSTDVVLSPGLLKSPGRMPAPETVSAFPEASVGEDTGEALIGLALGPDWLRQQSPVHYTVQVFASKDAQAVRRFMNSHRLARQVAVYPFQKTGERWYGVVYGRFDSRAAARQALHDLPVEVQTGGPWVRQLKDVVGQLDTSIERDQTQ